MRRFVFAAAVVLALPGAVLTVLRLVPWDVGTPWMQLLAFFPAALLLTAAAVACALLTLDCHAGTARVLLAALTTALLAAQFSIMAPRIMAGAPQAEGKAASPRPGVPYVPDGRTITVMALNVGSTGIDVSTLLAEVRRRNVDVLALPELAPAGLEALDGAGLASELPHRVLDVDWAGTGSALFARFPLHPQERIPGSFFYQTRAEAFVPGAVAPLRLTAVHVDSPRPGHTPRWRSELRQLGSLHAGLPDGAPAILLGDFNAAADHREFRELLETGLTDAAQAAGKGATPTWPVNGPVPPFVALDHILVSAGVRVEEFDRVLVPRSDHAAIVARLALP